MVINCVIFYYDSISHTYTVHNNIKNDYHDTGLTVLLSKRLYKVHDFLQSVIDCLHKPCFASLLVFSLTFCVLVDGLVTRFGTRLDRGST